MSTIGKFLRSRCGSGSEPMHKRSGCTRISTGKKLLMTNVTGSLPVSIAPRNGLLYLQLRELVDKAAQVKDGGMAMTFRMCHPSARRLLNLDTLQHLVQVHVMCQLRRQPPVPGCLPCFHGLLHRLHRRRCCRHKPKTISFCRHWAPSWDGNNLNGAR